MPRGTVKRIISDRGFGFIKPEGGGPDLFFHRSAVANGFEKLAEGDQIEFEYGNSPKGPRAEDIRQVQ